MPEARIKSGMQSIVRFDGAEKEIFCHGEFVDRSVSSGRKSAGSSTKGSFTIWWFEKLKSQIDLPPPSIHTAMPATK